MVTMNDNSIAVREYAEANLRAAASCIYDDGNCETGRSALNFADKAFEIMNCQFEKKKYEAHTFGTLIDFDNRLSAMELDLKEMETKYE
ncbi:MAG: hypothetical protein ABIF18_03600 [archaeon]